MALVPLSIRARGEVRARFASEAGRTHIAEAYETGGLRLRFPRGERGCEATIVNTGGGVAGGDRQAIEVDVGAGSQVTLTTPCAEKVYPAQNDAAEINVALSLSEGSALDWLPQETILFDGARLQRRVDVDMAADARLTFVESVIFGRLAMGEVRIEGAFRDRWRVRRERALVFAEDMRLEGDIASALDRPAVARRGRASATLLHVAPDAEGALERVRAAIDEGACEAGASAWNGLLVARFTSPAPEILKVALTHVLRSLRGCEAPRVWS